MVSGIRAGRPHDLEPLEHGLDRITHREAIPVGLSREVAAMRIEPPFAAPVAFALIPRELVVDCIERFDLDFGCLPDALRDAVAINDDNEVAGFGQCRWNIRIEQVARF